MKTIGFFYAGMVTFSSLVVGDGEENGMTKLYNALNRCRNDYPSVNDAKVLSIMRHEALPTNRDEMCLANCSLTEAELLKNKVVDVEAWENVNKIKWRRPSDVAIANKNTIDCKNETHDSDDCEYCYKIIRCFFGRNNESHLPPPYLPGNK